MSDAAAWFAKRAKQLGERPTLGIAILGGSWWRYGLHRLQNLLLVRGAAIAMHILEVVVLVRVASLGIAQLGFVIVNLGVLLTAAWWGATEILRARVRAARLPGEVEFEVSRWLGMAWLLAAIAVMIGVAISSWFFIHGQYVGGVYVLLVAARLAIDLVLRVWHAAVAARGRMFRNPWASVGVELSAAVVLIGVALWGLAPLVLLALAYAMLGARLVTWYYIRRAWRLARYGVVTARRGLSVPVFKVLVSSLAGAATRISSLVAVIILVMPRFPPHVAVGMHLAMGVIGIANSWTWTHYHDLIPLQLSGLTAIRARVERAIIAEAVVVGVVVGALTILVVVVFSPGPPPLIPGPDEIIFIQPPRPATAPYALALPLIAFSLSLLATAHVAAFCREKFGVVVASGIALAVATMVIPSASAWASSAEEGARAAASIRTQHVWLAVAIAVITAVAFGYLRWSGNVQRTLRGRVAWLDAEVCASREPHGVFVIRLACGGAMAEHIARTLEQADVLYVALSGRKLLVATSDPASLPTALLAASSGWVRSVTPWATAITAARRDVTTLTASTRPVITFSLGCPPPKGLERNELSRAWQAVLGYCHGRQVADAEVVGVTFANDQLATASLRLQLRRR